MRVLGGYKVSHDEVLGFLDANSSVEVWLRKYASGPRGGISGSKLNKARILCRFFKWLRIGDEERGREPIDLSPSQLLDRQLKMRQSPSVQDRQWLLNLVLQHSRDNPDFTSYADMRKYDVFNTVKGFFDYNEVPLTTGNNVYGKKRKKKNHPKQITMADAKRLLGKMGQRDRAINFVQLQSGMGIGEVLNKFNYFWFDQVKPQLDEGRERLRIEFDERKGNGTWYFTFIARDAVHELRKWLQERQAIVEKVLASGKSLDAKTIQGEPIFITVRGTPLTERHFLQQYNKKFNGRLTTHMFRKLFESEAKVPDRAIDRGIIKFWMGHITDMDDVGGVYDRNPEIRAEIFEKEYAKLEPYINIYSGVQVAEDQKLVEMFRDREVQEWLLRKMREDGVKV